MAYTTYFGTGFEMGDWPLSDTERNGGTGVEATTSSPKTGAYSLSIYNSWARFPFSPSGDTVYGCVAIKPSTTVDDIRIYFINSSGNTVSFRVNTGTGVWQAFRSSTLLASGSTTMNGGTYYVIQFYVYINSSSGRMSLKLEDSTEIDFTGNTDPSGGTSIEYVRVNNFDEVTIYIDNVSIGDGGWSGDRRFRFLIPNSDGTPNQWTPSTGSYAFEVINDLPANNATYLYTITSGYESRFELSTVSEAGKDFQNVIAWVLAYETQGSGSDLEYGISLSGVDDFTLTSLSPNPEYYSTIYYNSPTASGWTYDDIANLQFAIKAHI